MTHVKPIYRGKLARNISSILCISLAILMISFGKAIKDSIYNGLLFSLTTIIPTLFPFFILSDLWTSLFYVNPDGKVCRCFEKMFRTNGCAITALISGLICGFPIGVKVLSELYREEKISKQEFEYLSGFTNNPSSAFVISGIGAGIYKDIKIGILLYLSIIFSSVVTGFIFRPKKAIHRKTDENARQSFNFTESIKNAGLTSINVTSCIIFFSALIGFISAIINNNGIVNAISLVLEVTNAVEMISSAENLTLSIKLILTSFALGFSGLSVHIQAFGFMPREISKTRYLLMKLTQGLISSLLITILLLI